MRGSTYPSPVTTPVLLFDDVSVVRGSTLPVNSVSLSIEAGQRWVVIGPNGAGKSTLLHVAAAMAAPAMGTATVLGEVLGRANVAELRTRIGFAGAALLDRIPGNETVGNAVMTGAWAVYARKREDYGIADEVRRDHLLTMFGLTSLIGRTFGTLSEGERKRVMIARALMPDPELLILDEPAAGLDLAAREDLLRRLTWLADDPMAPTTIMATHHLEEIPPGATHALALRQGALVAAGPIADVLTDEVLTTAFGLPITVERVGDTRPRWFARARAW
ncbi:MAG: ATP-binding cassette domain-containing protein [Actinomycetales bacterium]|nr:ATP-binding cassette domain-containing protein [Actinomycetales bacterium]